MKIEIIRQDDGSPVVRGMEKSHATPESAMSEYVSWFKASEGMTRVDTTHAISRDGIRLEARAR